LRLQLTASRPGSLTVRLRAAACVLLAGTPAVAGATTTSGGSTQIDVSTLLYGEASRTNVFEPMLRLSHQMADGQSFSAQFTVDAMTGASPTGALPSGAVQTTTSASGTTSVTRAGQVPVNQYQDLRKALGLEYQRPLGLLTLTVGANGSREKDYRSIGGHGKVAVDLAHRSTQLTVGGAYDQDQVLPIGGTPIGLSDGTARSTETNPKTVTSALLGISQVLTRRWLVGMAGSRTMERGYLTEPYKVVSILDDAQTVVGQLTEKRPDQRDRSDVLVTSAYQLGDDVLHSSYRYYWDSWGVRSQTVDLNYRHDLNELSFLQPHLRLYDQTAADFYTFGLRQGVPLPNFATADYRLGPLRTSTVGLTYGFHLPHYPGEFSVRAEYIRQWGKGPGHHEGGEGEGNEAPVTTDPASLNETSAMPAVDIATIMFGYSLSF